MTATETIRYHDDVRADPVIALRNVATGTTWVLPDRTPLTIGSSPACDVVIAKHGISAHHATIERAPGGWHLRDASSKNGCLLGGLRAGAFEIAASMCFQLADTLLVALSPMMLAAVAAVELYVGLDQPGAVSKVLIAAHRDEPVLVAGAPGAGHVELGRAIHAISRRRKQPLIDLSGPEAAKRWHLARSYQAATAIVDLGRLAPSELVRDVWTALGGRTRWRWILTAENEAHASRVLGLAHLRSAHLIALRPMHKRTDDRLAVVRRLLGQIAPVELATLPETTQRILTASRAYASLADLRETVRRVATIATGGVNRSVAAILGLDLEHLELWAAKVGLSQRR